MIINHTFKINDEPLSSKSTGIRSATLKYTGSKFIYAEVCNATKKFQTVVHWAEQPELDSAKSKNSDITTRTIVEVDASKLPLLASIISDRYELTVDDYTETLSDGTLYEYKYSTPAALAEIFDIHNLKFDIQKGDIEEYRYITIGASKDEFIQSVSTIVDRVAQSLLENQFSSDEITAISQYKTDLESVITKVNAGIPHWKIPYPTCSVRW